MPSLSSSRSRWLLTTLPFAVMVPLVGACSFIVDSAEQGTSSANNNSSGAAGVPTTSIKIATVAARSGGPTNATWAAVRREDGSWSALAPTSMGVYTFETPTAAPSGKWAVAFVCADEENSLVAIHEDAITVTSVEVLLESWCAPKHDLFTITGTLSNVSSSTSWLDFGYPLESRGVTLPLSGTSATYEEVNVTSGTWDLAFGLRDDPGTMLTKIALLRTQTLSADATLNVDLGGGQAFAPGSKKLVIHAIDPNELGNIAVPVRYATGAGDQGIDLGPQNIPGGADLDLTYSTVPSNMQLPTDHYRVALTASIEDESARGLTGSFHDAIDLDLRLPAALTGVTATPSTSSAYARITTSVPIPATAASNLIAVESTVSARISNKSHREWRMSVGKAALPVGAAAVSLEMPDFSAVPGFDVARWTLPSDREKSATGTIRGAPVPLGDGTATQFASRTVFLPAP